MCYLVFVWFPLIIPDEALLLWESPYGANTGDSFQEVTIYIGDRLTDLILLSCLDVATYTPYNINQWMN